jgi:hypothetical protein
MHHFGRGDKAKAIRAKRSPFQAAPASSFRRAPQIVYAAPGKTKKSMTMFLGLAKAQIDAMRTRRRHRS